MNGRKSINKIMIGLWLTCIMALVHAGAPLWTFTPLTATIITVGANDNATVSYQVTNESKKTHTLAMQAISGVTQITTSGNCPTLFVLGYQQSCILTLSINGSSLKGNILGGPIVCSEGNPNQCYQPSSANSLHITKGPAVDYTVGGSVFGLSGTLVLENNGGDVLTMNADGSFTFSNTLSPGNTYLVTVLTQPSTQTCTVTNGSGTITNANITNVTMNCSINTRTVGGGASGLAASESVVLQNNGSDNLTVNSNGSFTFSTPIAQGATYNVTILTQPSTQTCTVTNGSGTAGASNVTNVQVICATNAYTVGGTVSGLSGTVLLQDNSGDNLTINSNGSFTFATPVAQGAPYSVTVLTQPTGQTCSVSNGSGTMGGANVTNVGVTCVMNTTTLSTSVSQLALSVTGLTEYGVSGTPSSGLARVITITNTGGNPAVNLTVTQPVWPFGTSIDNTLATRCVNGQTLGTGGTCTITIVPGATATSDGTNPCSSGTAPVPGVVQVSADNATTVSSDVVVLGYGCSYQGGYVYAFDDTTPTSGSVGGKVVTTSDQAAASPNGIVWSSNGAGGDSANVSYDTIPLIAQSSSTPSSYANARNVYNNTYANEATFPFPASSNFLSCSGASNGACNTRNILAFYGVYTTNRTSSCSSSGSCMVSSGATDPNLYAAGLCTQTIAGYSDWYLPAICEMGYGSNCGTLAAPTLQNIQKSLINSSGFSAPTGEYWSSTEYSLGPQTGAWGLVFSTSGSTAQADGKNNQRGVRCSRTF